MKIGITNDHHGIKINYELTNFLINKGYNVINYGPITDEPVDYPIYAFKLGKAIVNNDIDFGIALCNTGIGISIACNKVKGVRCAKVNNVWEAEMTRLDNDANVVAIGTNLDFETIKEIVIKFLETDFSRVDRHQRRIELIDKYND